MIYSRIDNNSVTIYLKRLLLVLVLFYSSAVSSQIQINMCPITKIPADKQFNIGEITITNNTGVAINTRLNKFKFEWPGLVKLASDLSGTFNGDIWEGKIQVNNWPNEVTSGATSTPKAFQGSNYEGALQIPAGGTFTQDGVEYEVTITHCAQTDAYELYDTEFEFSRECFQSSPTSGLCLGEAASIVWDGTGVRDIMVPEDRSSYAIGIMVAYRLFANLVGSDDMVSPHFWWATGLNETGMICEGQNYTARRKNHCYVNASDHTCEADGIGDNGGKSSADNCFQILSYGGFLQTNQPNLFTAGAADVVGGGHFETGLIAVTYYHYQCVQYWNHISGYDVKQLAKDAKDPYAIEKLFYHAFHDGHGAGKVLLDDIYANYDAAIAADDMTPIVSGNTPTWRNTLSGSPKVANFTALLDGNGNPYPQDKIDKTIEYYGCYSEELDWNDVLYYLNEVKILYPQLMDADVQNDIKEVFDGINAGADVNFTDFGPIIDEIVIQMGGHDPSDFLATQFGGSTSYDEPPLGVSLRSFDTICPGEEGTLQLWIAGTAPFKADVLYPDNTIHSFENIEGSPYYITVDQPGEYNVVHFQDANQVGNVDCNFGSITVESKNSAIIGWDRSNFNSVDQCVEGDLIINKDGEVEVTISYTLDGTPQPDVVMTEDETYKTIASNIDGGEYNITNMNPNACAAPINDVITMCGTTITPCTPPTYSILTPDTSFCTNESGDIRLIFSGTGPFDLYYTSSVDGVQSVIGINSTTYKIPVSAAQTIKVDSLVDQTCTNTLAETVIVTVNALPVVSLGGDATICNTATLTLDAQNTGASYLWSTTETSQTIDITTDDTYSVDVTDVNGCKNTDDIIVTTQSCTCTPPTYSILTPDTSFCANESGDIRLIFSGTGPFDLYYTSSIDGDQSVIGIISNTYQIPVSAAQTIKIDSVVDQVCTNNTTTSVVVTINLLPLLELGNDTTICNSAILTLNAQNIGSSYSWSTTSSSQTIDVLTDGTYTVEVTDVNGCIATDDIIVTTESCTCIPPSYSILTPDTSFCSGESGTIRLSFSGTAPFNLYYTPSIGSQESILGINTTTYEIPVSVAQTIRIDSLVDQTCANKLVSNVAVSVTPYPIVDLGSDKSICGNVNLILDAGNVGASYLWSTSETGQTINTNTGGTYLVDVTLNGCTTRDEIIVNQNALPSVDLGDNVAICEGASITIDAQNPGMTYLWSTGAITQTISVNTSDSYDVKVTDTDGCDGVGTIEVTVNVIPVVELGNDTTICEGVTLVLDAENTGFNYLWSTTESSQIIEVSASGTYELTVLGVGVGCSDKGEIKVTVQDNPIVALGDDKAVCLGESYVLDAQNTGLEYLWSTGEFSKEIEVITSGLYTVKVTDAFGCSETGDFDFIVNPLPEVSITLVDNVCYESDLLSIQTMPLGGILYGSGVVGTQFNPKSLDLEVDKPTMVYYTYTDANNCTSKDSTLITLRSNPEPVISASELVLCKDEAGVLKTAKSSYATYNWFNSTGASLSTSSSYTVIDEEEYFVQVSNSYCVGTSNKISIEVINVKVEVGVFPEGAIMEGESAQLFVFNPQTGYGYIWGNNLDNSTQTGTSWDVSPLQSTAYTVTASLGECSASSSVDVQVNKFLSIPNAFTANGDGVNDTWNIEGIEGYSDLKIQVFNRWGALVYVRYGDYEVWNGTSKSGDQLPQGTYYYIIELNDNKETIYRGDISIIR
jgi:gliding motility-associated-like protein